jgi:hypothetical protein
VIVEAARPLRLVVALDEGIRLGGEKAYAACGIGLRIGAVHDHFVG